jgi:hypothetical protein
MTVAARMDGLWPANSDNQIPTPVVSSGAQLLESASDCSRIGVPLVLSGIRIQTGPRDRHVIVGVVHRDAGHSGRGPAGAKYGRILVEPLVANDHGLLYGRACVGGRLGE